ncbi:MULTISPECIES: HAD-IC family P-type ATPase [Methylomicrobium]|uniref:HAD-IC family P-type ATPase n=1 Tax=Methylomicrobium TaxID=39773 RepID=UPI00020D8EF9|nr:MULTISPECIES: HAD-IC family P-type ATPase [Methylomicrobium]
MQGLADTVRACGIDQVILATGDNEEQEAKRVTDYIHADGDYFNCKPEAKTALVKQFQAEGKVAMVGDGINDAPAPAAAHVGIAIGGYKNVNLAIMSSDVVILGQDAQDLVTILRLSHKMGGIIRQNYLWAVSFNSIGLALATFGMLNPIFAALLHHVSSVFVVVNAARLYFSGIEQSLIGPVFRKMDALTLRKPHHGEESALTSFERGEKTVAEQKS